MLRRFRRTRVSTVDFCGRGTRVCDVACRADAFRERALVSALRVGVRF